MDAHIPSPSGAPPGVLKTDCPFAGSAIAPVIVPGYKFVVLPEPRHAPVLIEVRVQATRTSRARVAGVQDFVSAGPPYANLAETAHVGRTPAVPRELVGTDEVAVACALPV